MYTWIETGQWKAWAPTQPFANDNDILDCDWASVRDQLLEQWKRLSKRELDAAGPHRQAIASLVQNKYGIDSVLVENYLANLERTLPLAGGGINAC